MDQTLFHLINEQWTNPAMDLFMAALSDSEIWKPFLIAIGLGALFFGGFKARAFVVCLALSLLIAELFTGVLKSAVDRHRPKQVESVRMVELQKARPKFMCHPFFRPNRSQSFGAVVSIGTHDKQHDNRRVLHTVLSPARLALLDHCRSHRLLANLSRCALAQRHRRDVVPSRW